MEEKGRGSPGQIPRGRTGVGARYERVSAEPTCRGNYPCIQREVNAIGPHDGARTRAQNRLSRNSPDALTSLWISVKELTGRVGGGTPDVGGVTVGGEGGLRGRGSTGSLQNGRNGGGGLGSVDGCRRRVREKGATRFRSSQGFQSAERSRSASAPRRAARPDPTRAWIQIIWSVDNVNRAFVAPRRAGSGTNSR